ncbi:MAG: hypothetical protein KIT56_05580 [Gammaproteobacteria bacterium]|nr:hypothetical protein [Gammaproteobacteria bacterium]MCW5583342.1 hypothetical protein [Gammaproteobacteria bacterium]
MEITQYDDIERSFQFAEEILSQIPVDLQYRYEMLQPIHIDRVVTMFTQAFCDAEPMTHYLGVSYQSFKQFALAVTEKASEEKLSVVALDDDRVIACALTEDLVNPLDIIFELDPKFKPIFNILEQLSAKFFADKKIEKNHIAHLFITAVDESYRGKGLSKQVNYRSMALAAGMNFSFMMSELTNYINTNGIMHHLHYNKILLGSQIYQNYVFEGIKPFKDLSGIATSYLWELRKDAMLTYKQNNKRQQKLLRLIRNSR